MIPETDPDYHMRRARAELDLAHLSECPAAMESHLHLSSLHLRQWERAKVATRTSASREATDDLADDKALQFLRCGE